MNRKGIAQSPQGCVGYIVFSIHGFYPLNPIRSTVCIHTMFQLLSAMKCVTQIINFYSAGLVIVIGTLESSCVPCMLAAASIQGQREMLLY